MFGVGDMGFDIFGVGLKILWAYLKTCTGVREKERGRVEEKCVMWELGIMKYVRLYGDV